MRRFLLSTIMVLALVPALAFADSDLGYRGWGPRLGATIDPDQFHFGFHVDFGEFTNNLRFQPNFELGIGDDLTVGAMNLETEYLFEGRRSEWSPYAGGGLGINFIGSDDRGFRDDTDTDVGLNMLGGIEKNMSDGDAFFTEVKFGLTDAPDVKFTLGWTFH